MRYNQSDLINIVSNFEIKEGVAAVEDFGMGHINDTYIIKSASDNQPGYLLQRINHMIFKDVPALMNNILLVTDHLKAKLKSVPGANPETEVLTPVVTKNNLHYFLDSEGKYWRMYRYIQNTKSIDIIETPEQAFEGGKAFGKFQILLSDLDINLLHETIPAFHDIGLRLAHFNTALEADVLDRKKQVAAEIAFIQQRVARMFAILNLAREEGLPIRITHNDTKFNNILLDKDNHAQCVIDLDTVMPGHVAYDFGDAVRSIINTVAEDEPDLSKIGLNIPLFEAFALGYLIESVEWLTEVEIKSLCLSVQLFPYMQGVRFLTDYLQGDTYYKTQFPNHNLQRARAQFKLLMKIEEQYETIEDIIWETANRCLDLRYEQNKHTDD